MRIIKTAFAVAALVWKYIPFGAKLGLVSCILFALQNEIVSALLILFWVGIAACRLLNATARLEG